MLNRFIQQYVASTVIYTAEITKTINSAGNIPTDTLLGIIVFGQGFARATAPLGSRRSTYIYPPVEVWYPNYGGCSCYWRDSATA